MSEIKLPNKVIWCYKKYVLGQQRIHFKYVSLSFGCSFNFSAKQFTILISYNTSKILLSKVSQNK